MTSPRKRFTRTAFAGALILSLAACGGTDEAAEDTTADTSTESEAESSEPESTPSTPESTSSTDESTEDGATDLEAELRASNSFNDSDFTSLSADQQDCVISGVAAQPALAESALEGVDPPDSEMVAYTRILLECVPGMLREIMADGDPETQAIVASLSDDDLLCIVDALSEDPALMNEALEGGDETAIGLTVLDCAPEAFAEEMALELGITTEQATCLLDGDLTFMQIVLGADDASEEDFFSFIEEMTAAFEDCDIEVEGMMDTSGSGAYNEEELAEYRAECEAGDMAACDDLYFAAPSGSEDEAFAAICGGVDGDAAPGSCEYTERMSIELLEFYRGCEAGDMEACDNLYLASPSGSDFEELGATCGGTTDDRPSGGCEFSAGMSTELAEYREGCTAGDMEACDNLYFASPSGSDDEEFGATCGGTTDDRPSGGCEFSAGMSTELAEYREGCTAGDMEACDNLYFASPSGSDDEEFGATCGGTTDGAEPGWCSMSEL